MGSLGREGINQRFRGWAVTERGIRWTKWVLEGERERVLYIIPIQFDRIELERGKNICKEKEVK